MKHGLFKKPEFYISAGGLLALAAVFALWYFGSPHSAPGTAAALFSAALFAAACLRFVPEWTRFWGPAPSGETLPERDADAAEPKHVYLRIALAFLLADAAVLLAVYALRGLLGYGERGIAEGLQFWTCLDSGQYLDIVRDWYPSEGEWDQLVRLVFLPGYPLAVRLANLIVGNELYAAFLVSALSFAGAGCVFYRLLRLDLPHESAVRALKYLCILPGAFFFAAPMSESLFLLLCLSCLYLARTGKWAPGCALGGLAAFTRSLGLTLLVPLLLELVHAARRERDARRAVSRGAALLLIPAGFGAYCFVNYAVSGNPFQFMIYQSEHWNQRLGWFFNTAAYQTDYAIASFGVKNDRLLGLWLPNLIAGFASLGIMIPAAKKRLRASDTAWFLAYYFVAMGATWLLSAPRYLAAMPVLPKALSALTERRRADAAATALCAVLYALYLYAFARRWQVW